MRGQGGIHCQAKQNGNVTDNNNIKIILILISLNAVLSLVPSLKFHMHNKLYNPYYS